MSQVASPIPSNPNRDSLAAYIEQAARNMRRTDFFFGLLWWLTVVLFIITATVLVDHWCWTFNKPARFAVSSGLLLWSLWWLPRRVLPPMLHPIQVEYAVRTIEKQFPECKDSLISWLQLSREDSKTPKGVVSYLGRYAVRGLGGHDSQSVVDSATVVRLAAAFFGCLLCSAIYMFASPKSGMTSIARLVLPWADIAPAARVQIVEVLPGSTTVTQGSILPLTVTVRGMHQGEKVSIQFDLSDSQLVGQTLTMSPEIERINYKLDLGKTFGGIHQPLKYWVHAGDAVEGPFEVKVQLVPLVAVERTELQFPAYTKLKSRVVLQTGSFEAPEGTHVNLFASANQQMKSARLEFDPVIEQGVFQTARDVVGMNIETDQLTGHWLATLDDQSTNPTITSYRISATNQLGESNADPVLYQTKIIADLPPEISLDSDVPHIVEIPASGSLDLEVRGNDPDYGLSTIQVFASQANPSLALDRTELLRETIFESEEGVLGQVSRTWKLQPSHYGWKPGMELDLFAEALDNRHDPKTEQLKPNRSVSSPLKVRVIEDQVADTDATPTPNQQPDPKEENKPSKTRTKWELTPDKKENSKSKGRDTTESNKGDSKSQSNRPDQDSGNNPPGIGTSNPDDAESKTGQGEKKGKGQSKGDGKGDNKESTPDSESSANSESDSDGSSQPSSGKKSSPSSSGSANAKPPSHDGEAIERIEQFRREQEANQPISDPSSMKKDSKDHPRPDQNDTDEDGPGEKGASKEGASKEGTGKEGTGKEGAGKEGAGKEGTGKEGTGKEGTGKEGTGKEGTGKEGTGKEGTGKEGTGKEGTGKEGAGKEGTGKEGAGKEGAGKEGAGKEGAGKDGAGKEGAGKEGAGKEGAGKEGAGKEGAGKEGAGKEGAGKEGAGKEGTGKEGTGKEGTGKEGTGKEGTGKEGAGKEGAGKEGAGKEGAGKEGAGKAGNTDDGTDAQGDSSDSANPSSSKGGPAGQGVNRGGAADGVSRFGGSGTSKIEGAEKANLEYAEKTTDMVLDYLDRQRDQPDPELLRRMGWTADDLRKFADRWKSAREQSRMTPEKRAEFEAALKSLGLRLADRGPTRLEDRDDTLKGMQEEGARLRPPESLREQFEAFRKAAGKLNKSP